MTPGTASAKGLSIILPCSACIANSSADSTTSNGNNWYSRNPTT